MKNNKIIGIICLIIAWASVVFIFVGFFYPAVWQSYFTYIPFLGIIFGYIGARLFSKISKLLKRLSLISIILIVLEVVILFLYIITFSCCGPVSRDSKRIAEIRQVQTGLDLYYKDYSMYPKCDSSTAINEMATNENCTKFTPSSNLTKYIAGINNFKDPSGKKKLCTANSTSECEYAFQDNSADPSDYKIYFYLVKDVGSLSLGVHVATPGGIE